jgi:Succinate dehydrogenase/fumarate reductase, flavoprotein subunit
MIFNEGGQSRTLKTDVLYTDLVVTGGGVSGLCAAVTAARRGIKVVLIQDRPVLGGNASSEVRLWMLGATSHMGNNNRWAREGGVVNELMIENMYRNPEGNPLIFDTIMLEMVVKEPNITLLLNTAVYEIEKRSADTIKSVKAFCSQNSTTYIVHAPLFVDASGDGIVGFLAGAAFRMGAESAGEFGELFAPTKEYGELLGHSLYFYTKDTGKPVKFIPPAYALEDIQQIPRFRQFNAKEYGCNLWWLEYGGRLDTVHDTETIKWELWRVVYAAWNYIKNSGNFPEAETMTLEWVGTIPGKRESRRFEGDYILRQQDVVEQRHHNDAVAFGGWSIDLHPADGVFSEKPGCNQWHSKGIYPIPYRCLYSRNISNLFLGGRLISVSHVAFGSSRVMATAAHASQAVGMAASLCKEKGLLPREIFTQNMVPVLQERLFETSQHIPGIYISHNKDLVQQAIITASSELILTELPEENKLIPLDTSVAQMVPLPKGKPGLFVFHAESEVETILDVAFRVSSKATNHTPDITQCRQTIAIHKGRNCLRLQFDAKMQEDAYAFITFFQNNNIKMHHTSKRVTGILSVFNTINKSVSNYGKQTPPPGIGIDAFEFWVPKRRPGGENLAFKYPDGIKAFAAPNVANNIDRPTHHPNAWVADWNDPSPTLHLQWKQAVTIKQVDLFFDVDYDHPMETVFMGHPENIMPFCVRNFRVKDDQGNVLAHVTNNHQYMYSLKLDKAIQTQSLHIEVEHPGKDVPAALFSVRCYQ